MSLVDELRLLAGSGERWEVLTGTVTQASPLLVQVPPTPVGMPATRLASYTPSAGDRVLLVVSATARYVLGAIA